MRKALWALMILCALLMASPAWSQDIAGAELYSGGLWSPAPSAGAVGPLSTVTPVHLYCYNSSLQAWVVADSSCFGGALPGVTSDGANGLLVTGQITAANYAGLVQPLQAYLPRSLDTKLANMTLFNNGVSGYSTPVQAMLITMGDSTAGHHAGEFICNLVASWGLAGYFNGGANGLGPSAAYKCAAGTGGWNPAYAGGGAAVTGDFAHFPYNGSGSSLPSGATATNASATYSSRIMAYFTANVGTTTVTVSTSTDNVTYTPLPSCTALTVTASVGGVCDTTLTAGFYYVRVTSGGTGTLFLWAVGQVATNMAGVVVGNLAQGGTSLPDQASASSAITNPWMASLHPDAITAEWRDNGINAGAPACLQAPTATPGNLHNRTFWWNQFMAPILAAAPLADAIYYGSPDVSDACIPVFNAAQQAWAYSQNPKQPYIDNYSVATDAQQQTLGWKANGNVHQTSLGQLVQGDWDAWWMGHTTFPSAWSAKNVGANHVAANDFWIGPNLNAQTPGVGLQATYSAGTILPGQPVAHMYSLSASPSNVHVDFTNQWDFNSWDATKTFLCLGDTAAQCRNNLQGLQVSSTALSHYTASGNASNFFDTNASQGIWLWDYNLSNNNTKRNQFQLWSNGSQSWLKYFEGTASLTEYWDVGLPCCQDHSYAIQDAVKSTKVLYFPSNTMPTNSITGNAAGAQLLVFQSVTNCSSAASPAVCAAAPAGSVVVAAAGTTVVVNTTAVTANSQIFVQEDSSLGTKLSVTCNVTPATAPPTISARVAATSFTITTTAPTTNPRCFSYTVVN